MAPSSAGSAPIPTSTPSRRPNAPFCSRKSSPPSAASPPPSPTRSTTPSKPSSTSSISPAPTTNPEVQSYLDSADQELSRVAQIANQTLRFHKQQSAATPDRPARPAHLRPHPLRQQAQPRRRPPPHRSRPTPPLTCFAGRSARSSPTSSATPSTPCPRRRPPPARPPRHLPAHPAQRRPHHRRRRRPRHVPRRPPSHLQALLHHQGQPRHRPRLWVSRGIVEKHHGRLEVRSSDHPRRSGTIFTLFFPSPAKPAASTAVVLDPA